jgi:hypothetical protein
MQTKARFLPAAGLAASSILLLGAFAPSEAQDSPPPVPATQVVWQHVGRFYLNPTTGQAVYAGYVVHLNPISNSGVSLFNGSPSESTAYFTFSTDVIQLTPLPNNNDLALYLISAGTFSVYYNANPNGDWSNPSSFSSGKLIATFTREQSLYSQFASIGVHSLSETLTSSRDFTFMGQKYNMKSIAPHGITFAQFFSTAATTGTSTYPYAFAAAGTTMAVGPTVP